MFETSVEGRTSVSSDRAGHWGGFPHCWFGHRGGFGWGWGRHGFGWHRESGGDNNVVIEDSTLGDLSVRTGRGDDNVVVTGTSVDGKVHGWTGRGDDFVMAEDVSVKGRTTLQQGAGDDALVTQGTNTFEDDLYASGGCGDDARQISAETVFDGASKLRRFESTSVDESVIEERGVATLAAAADLRSILNVPGGITAESDEGFVLV
ncbi:MAG: hypothetical protein GX591_08685 [Planctomycetes bacterium]|nr:hypothetical protein [Planctomycetota bacterium]